MPPVLRTAAAFVVLMMAVHGTSVAQEGPTAPPPLDERDADGRLVGGSMVLGARGHAAEWALPDAAPTGLVVLAHGFLRRCAHLRGTARALRRAGLAVLCLDRGLGGLDADALAAWLAAAPRLPDGRPVPTRTAVAGHSAGAAVAAEFASALARRAPRQLAGALLFDPVGSGASFADDLAAVSDRGRRPVRAITAGPGPCNLQGAAGRVLRRLADQARAGGGDAFVGVVLAQGATHVDAEGEDTEPLAWAACGDGPPRGATVALLRQLATHWVVDMVATDGPPGLLPGNPMLDAWRAEGRFSILQ